MDPTSMEKMMEALEGFGMFASVGAGVKQKFMDVGFSEENSERIATEILMCIADPGEK